MALFYSKDVKEASRKIREEERQRAHEDRLALQAELTEIASRNLDRVISQKDMIRYPLSLNRGGIKRDEGHAHNGLAGGFEDCFSPENNSAPKRLGCVGSIPAMGNCWQDERRRS